MRIIFIHPSNSCTGFNTEGKNILFSQVHTGLCTLSAVCKKKGFTDIDIIDVRMLQNWHEFRDKIIESKPDIVGITMMSPDYDYASKCIDLVKNINSKIRTVVGGMHPTVMTNEVISNNKIDYIIVGEGEIAFPELLQKLKDGRPSERVIKGERPDVNTLPFIDRELFDFLELPYDFFLELPFATILAGRGCAYNCHFCSPAGKIMHGYRARRRSVDNVIEEIKHLHDTYGIKSVQFWDDCFTEDKKWIMEFCDKYKNNKFKMPFVCQTRADIISKNPDMMKKLKKAGLVMASIGFESGNDRILKFINKGTTLKQNLQASRICKRLGIKIWAYHMFGLPTEKKEEALDTVRMIKKIKPYRSSAAFFTPHPGSYFFKYCEDNNLSLIDKHDSFVRFPEIDKPKIKNIDYKLMRKIAIISKKVTVGIKARIKIEKIIAHKKNKKFKIRFQEELKYNPSLKKMTVLRLAHQAGRI